MNLILPAANKSRPRIYYFCMILALHFMPPIANIKIQHEGHTFPISTSLKLSLPIISL